MDVAAALTRMVDGGAAPVEDKTSSLVESSTQDAATAKTHMALSEIHGAVPRQADTPSVGLCARDLFDEGRISMNASLAALRRSWACWVHLEVRAHRVLAAMEKARMTEAGLPRVMEG